MEILRLCYILLCMIILSACTERASFTITLKTNTGNAVGAKVTLTNSDNNDSPKVYQKTAESNVILFKKILTGMYHLSVEHEDYFPYLQGNILVENNDSGYIVDFFINGPVIFVLIPNFGSVQGARVILGDLDGNQQVEILEGNSVTFKRITSGEYYIDIFHDDFFDFRFGGFDAMSLVGNNEIRMYRKGAAGGYVFYDKGNYSNNWRYLEATHAGWEFVSNWDDASEEVKKINQNGFTGWRLPSKEELEMMYQNLRVKGSEDPFGAHVADFQPVSYWTHTQRGTFYQYAWCQTFDVGNLYSGHQHINPRNELARVRAVRPF